jgi:hypothetical protein
VPFIIISPKKGHYTHQLSNALKPTDGIAHRINTRPLIIIQINMQMNHYCLLQESFIFKKCPNTQETAWVICYSNSLMID